MARGERCRRPVGRPARADDRFRAGSVTKTFVATVVLQLVAEGRIRLDDPIGRHLPGLIPAGADGAQVTVRQLLGHTSGIPNYTDVLRRQPDPIRALQHSAYTPHELVAMALREPWAFDPGAPGHWQYSNTNYVVLGLLIERAGGHPLGREIERRIVRPLRLTDTLVPSGPDLPGRHLNGYEWLDGPGAAPTDLTGFSAGAFWGPGNMISTTADLNRFQQALSAGRLLPPRLLGEMRDVRDTDRAGRSYGLGLEANTTVCGTAQGPVRGHSGSVPGYNTFSFASADGRRRITLAVNVDLTKTRGADEALGRVLSTALCRPAPPAQPAAQAALLSPPAPSPRATGGSRGRFRRAHAEVVRGWQRAVGERGPHLGQDLLPLPEVGQFEALLEDAAGRGHMALRREEPRREEPEAALLALRRPQSVPHRAGPGRLAGRQQGGHRLPPERGLGGGQPASPPLSSARLANASV